MYYYVDYKESINSKSKTMWAFLLLVTGNVSFWKWHAVMPIMHSACLSRISEDFGGICKELDMMDKKIPM